MSFRKRNQNINIKTVFDSESQVKSLQPPNVTGSENFFVTDELVLSGAIHFPNDAEPDSAHLIANTSHLILSSSAGSVIHVSGGLNAADNVGIGTTSPQRAMHIVGSDGAVSSFPSSLGGKDFLVIENDDNCNMGFVANSANSMAIKFYDDAASGFRGIIKYGSSDTLGFGTSGNQDLMVIDSAGDVGIGTTSPNILGFGTSSTILSLSANGGSSVAELESTITSGGGSLGVIAFINNTDSVASIEGFRDGANDAGGIKFLTQATGGANNEKVRIDSDGDLHVNNTGDTHKFSVWENASGYTAAFFNDGNNANRQGIIIQCGADAGSGVTDYIQAKDGDGTEVGTIENNGGTFQLVDASDESLKSGIAPTTISGLDIINAINLIKFRFTRHGPSGSMHPIGFTAQNIQQVFPDAVSAFESGTLGVARSRLIPVLMKAVQELSSQNDLLLQRIEALESGSAG